MNVVTLMETGERDFLEGSDGAFYTPVRGVEARCRWCRVWAHQADLYYRQVLFTRRAALVNSLQDGVDGPVEYSMT